MTLISVIDVLLVGILVWLVLTKSLEGALPFFTFAIIMLPLESKIELSGLFDLTSSRVAISTLGVLFVFFGRTRSELPALQSTPFKYLILLNIAWGLFSTAHSVVPTISFKTVLSQSLDCFLIYYIFVRTVRDIKTVRKILFAFVGAMVVCCVFGLLESYYGWKVIDLFPRVIYRFSGYSDIDESRIRSTYPVHILFGCALTLVTPIAFYLLRVAKSGIQRAYLWIAIVLMFWNNYKTLSRGPWLALILSAVLLFLLAETKTRRYLLAVSVLTAAVLVIRPGVWETLRNTYYATLTPDDPRGDSYQYRYDLMRVAQQALAKDWSRAIWGFGPESFYYLGLEGEDSSGNIAKFESCDSAVVEIMVDTGYVGLLITGLLLIKATVMSLWNCQRSRGRTSLLPRVFFINLVAFCFMMLSVMNYGWGQQSHMLWILIALSVVYPCLVSTEPSTKGKIPSDRAGIDPPVVVVARC